MTTRVLGDFGVPAAGRGVSLRDVLQVVFRRKRIVLGAVGFTTLFAAVGSYVLPPSYKAEAQIYVQREKPGAPELHGDQPGRPLLTRDDVINSQIALLLSRAVVAEAVDTTEYYTRPGRRTLIGDLIRYAKEPIFWLGLWQRSEPRERAIRKLRKRIKVKAEPDSDVIAIWHISDQPALSAELVNAVVDAYLNQRTESHTKSERYTFFRQQLEHAQAESAELEAQRTALKDEWGIVEIAQEKRLALDALAITENRMQETRGALHETERRIETLQLDIAELPERLLVESDEEPSEAYDVLVAQLSQLEAEEARRLVKWPPDDPRILELRDAIAAVKARLATVNRLVPTERHALNTVRLALLEQQKLAEADLEGLRAKLRALEAERDTQHAYLLTLDNHEETLRQLDEQLKVAQARRHTYQERVEEARVQAESWPSLTNVWVVNQADVPTRPTLMPLLAIVLGFGLGVALATVLVAIAEYFDHAIHNRDDLYRHLGVPVLAVVPRLRE